MSTLIVQPRHRAMVAGRQSRQDYTGRVVRCADCGFVALRRIESAALVEADSQYRESGYPIQPMRAVTQESSVADYPVCFLRKWPLQEEIIDSQGIPVGSITEATVDVLTRQRPCDGFTEWQQGFSPKEHREMLDRKWLMDREDRRDKEAREFQRQLHREQLGIMGFGLMAATILGAVIGALLTR
jgi:hypothetical protein